MYKKLFINCFLIFFSQLSFSQAEQSKNGSREGEVFGLLLGSDSLAEVSKKTKYTERSLCKSRLFSNNSCKETHEIVYYTILEFKNKVYFISDLDGSSLKNNEVEFSAAEFQIDGVDFHGTFFEDKLISLQTRINPDDFENIKKSFDKKYKKKTSGNGKGEFKINEDTTYKFYRWIDEKSSFEVQITESTSFYNTVSECIADKQKLYYELSLKSTFGEFQNMCKKKVRHGFLDLNYRPVQFYPQFMNKVVEIISEKEKLKLIENQNKNNKNIQRVNKY